MNTKRQLLCLGLAAIFATGCAGNLPGDREQTCANAAAAYEVYKAVLNSGDKPSKEQVLAAAAAAAFLQINCGYVSPTTKSANGTTVNVDRNGVLILVAKKK